MSDSAILRSAKNLKVSDLATNVADTDTALSADSDQRFPTQKAFKAYADSKVAPDLSALPTTTTVDETDWILVYDVSQGVAKRAARSLFEVGSNSISSALELNSFYNEIEVGSGTHNIRIAPYRTSLSQNVWVAGNAINEARYTIGNAGTANAALIFGGGYSGGYSGTVETSDGVTWRVTTSITARWAVSGTGLKNSALRFGGGTDGNTAGISDPAEKFDGTTWSNTGAFNTPRRNFYGLCGHQNAALAPGGQTGGSSDATKSAVTEKFNGQTWSTTSSLSQARTAPATSGTQSAALCMGGHVSGGVTIVESFSGEAWHAVSSLNVPRVVPGGVGTLHATRVLGGNNNTTNVVSTEAFNGMSWKMDSDMLSARNGVAQCGTNASLQVAGGYGTSSHLNSSEKFYGDMAMNFRVMAKSADTDFVEMEAKSPAFSINGPAELYIDYVVQPQQVHSIEEVHGVVEVNHLDWGGGAWVTDAGWNLQLARFSMGGCGSQKAALMFCGWSSGLLSSSERFDNNTWTTISGGDVPQNLDNVGNAGIAGAALCYGGAVNSSNYVNNCYQFEGTSWAAAPSLNTGKITMSCAGVMNAAIAGGGHTTSNAGIKATETFDGSQWSNLSGGDLNMDRSYNGSTGSRYAAIAMGGTESNARPSSERFNGYTWHNDSPTNIGRMNCQASGSWFAALMVGGIDSSNNHEVPAEKYNGIYWITAPYPAVQRTSCRTVGSQQANLCFGGRDSGSTPQVSSEKFNTDLSSAMPFGALTY